MRKIVVIFLPISFTCVSGAQEKRLIEKVFLVPISYALRNNNFEFHTFHWRTVKTNCGADVASIIKPTSPDCSICCPIYGDDSVIAMASLPLCVDGFVLFLYLCKFLVGNHLAEEKRAGC